MKYLKQIQRAIYRLLHPCISIPTIDSSGSKQSINLDGRSLWVKSENIETQFNPEALASAFLIPALMTGRQLTGPAIDSLWLAHIQDAVRLISNWWQVPPRIPRFKNTYQGQAPTQEKTALAFSLGVDSFYSCFFGDPKPDILVFVAGFDVMPNDSELIARYQESLRQVALAAGMRWCIIHTNLRQHPTFRRAPWAYSHGGALAFIGHLLKPQVSRLMISSSYDRDHLGPYGSHPLLDRLWSSSDLQVQHFGEEIPRSLKLKKLVNHPIARKLVAKHLRVCWERQGIDGNCGYCKKCVLTRINLLRDAPDLMVETMPNEIPLPQAIDALGPLDLELSLNFRRELLDIADPAVRASLEKFIRRSEAEIAKNPGLKKI